jgi:hypothetical protein
MPELLHPRMADVYREKVGSLCLALENEDSRTGAADAIRAHVEAIVLEPDGERVKITLKGDLAGMLSATRDSKRSPNTSDLMVQIKLVAGACNRRYSGGEAPLDRRVMTRTALRSCSEAYDRAAGELDLRQHALAEAERVAEVGSVFVVQHRRLVTEMRPNPDRIPEEVFDAPAQTHGKLRL